MNERAGKGTLVLRIGRNPLHLQDADGRIINIRTAAHEEHDAFGDYPVLDRGGIPAHCPIRQGGTCSIGLLIRVIAFFISLQTSTLANGVPVNKSEVREMLYSKNVFVIASSENIERVGIVTHLLNFFGKESSLERFSKKTWNGRPDTLFMGGGIHWLKSVLKWKVSEGGPNPCGHFMCRSLSTINKLYGESGLNCVALSLCSAYGNVGAQLSSGSVLSVDYYPSGRIPQERSKYSERQSDNSKSDSCVGNCLFIPRFLVFLVSFVIALSLSAWAGGLYKQRRSFAAALFCGALLLAGLGFWWFICR